MFLCLHIENLHEILAPLKSVANLPLHTSQEPQVSWDCPTLTSKSPVLDEVAPVPRGWLGLAPHSGHCDLAPGTQGHIAAEVWPSLPGEGQLIAVPLKFGMATTPSG